MNTKAHSKTTGSKGLLTLAMALAVVAAFGLTSDAKAAGYVVIGGSSRGHCHSHYTPGYYTTSYQTVMVSPAQTVRQWVPAQYQTHYTPAGHPVVVKVRDGYWHNVYVPARYETRAVRTYVPGYRTHHRSPRAGVRIGFRF